MPASSQDERILPCLFDRLVDEHPDSRQDSRGERAISLNRYREGVLRDIAWLLNAKAHLDADELHLFGEAERSVLNYGIPDYCGQAASSLDLTHVEERIVEALQQYEDRLIPNTLSVQAVDSDDTPNPSVVAFEIRGDLWATPVPEQLYIRTQLDLETGQCLL